MRLYVTVSDGKVTAKNEVVVKVMSGSAGSRRPSRPSRPPNFPQLGGHPQLFPFPTNYVPPGVPVAPLPAIPPGIPSVNPGPPPSLGNYNRVPVPYPSRPPGTSSTDFTSSTGTQVSTPDNKLEAISTHPQTIPPLSKL